MAVNKDDAMNIAATGDEPVGATSAEQQSESTPASPPVTAPVAGNGGANGFADTWSRFTRFLRAVMVELRKTHWPTRNELVKFTVVVMVTIIVAALYLYLSNLVAEQIANRLFNVPANIPTR